MAMVFLSHFSFSSLQTTIGDWVDIFNLIALFFLLLNNIFLHVFDIRDYIHPPALYSPDSSRYARITNTLCREILVWQISYQNKRNLRQSNLPETATCPQRNPTPYSMIWPLSHTFNFLLQRSLYHNASEMSLTSQLGSVQALTSQDMQLYTCMWGKGCPFTGDWGQLFAVFSVSCTVGAWSLTGREHLGLS